MKKKLLALLLAVVTATSSSAAYIAAADVPVETTEEESVTTYTVQETSENAEVIFLNGTEFQADEMVNFCVIPDAGYTVESIEAYGVGGEIEVLPDTEDNYLFFMPASEVFLDVITVAETPPKEEEDMDSLMEDLGIADENKTPSDTSGESSGEIPSEEEPTEEGHLELDGYLEDGTPNYVWEGESQAPVITETAPADQKDDTSFYKVGVDNYLKDAEKIWDRVATLGGKGDNTSDGVHLTPDGHYRVYKDGHYFVKGRFSLNQDVYYADSNGYLLNGWLKLVKEGGDWNSKKASDYVWKYCFPDNYIRCELGYQVVDGVGHYFDHDYSGNLMFNKTYRVGSQDYYCDQYGVCGPTTFETSSTLARNASGVTVANSSTTMDGSYSFFPKFNSNSSVSPFGASFSTTSDGHKYCTLRDESLAGRIGCWYYNVGTYKGRQLDIKLTVTDYTLYSFEGDPEVGYFYVDMNKIGLNNCNTRDMTADLAFYDHETGQPVSVKGFITFADIDICQGVEILTSPDKVYVANDCELYKASGRNLFIAPWEEPPLNGNSINDDDTSHWVQVNYSGTHLKYKFYSARENYRFSNGMGDINGESKQVWQSGYTGSVSDYDIYKSGNLWQGWQGIFFKRLAKIPISEPLSKTVSDNNEKDVLKDRLDNRNETFTYKLSHYVPYEQSDYWYDSYKITDTIHSDLQINQSGIRVKLDSGSDVTSRFKVTVSGQNVTVSANSTRTSSFYNETYNVYIPVTIKSSVDLGSYVGGRDYSVKNTGKVTLTRSGRSESKTSNEVETVITLKDVPTPTPTPPTPTPTPPDKTPHGKISITKKDADSGSLLTGAEFVVYQYNKNTGNYEDTLGNKRSFIYYATRKKYESKLLEITDQNNGKFKVIETKNPEGYTGSWSKEVTFTKGGTSEQNISLTATNKKDTEVTPPPSEKVPKGRAKVIKTDADTGESLKGAEFVAHEYNKNTGRYEDTLGDKKYLKYDASENAYMSQYFECNEQNQGKFKIIETKNPEGYTGEWSGTIWCWNPIFDGGIEVTCYLRATNEKIQIPNPKGTVSVIKKDKDSGEIITSGDAEFALYQYDKERDTYTNVSLTEASRKLSWDAKQQKYVSKELEITDNNEGKFLVEETKNPAGYTGNWIKFFTLSDNSETELHQTFEAKNKPIYPKGTISVVKKDAVTGEVITSGDAVFQVDEYSKKYNSYVMDSGSTKKLLHWDADQSKYVSDELELTYDNEGKFRVREVENPEGYTGSWSQEVTLSDGSEAELHKTLEAENEPERLPGGEIKINKRIKESDITWAHGNPTFLFKVDGKDARGNAHTYETYVTFEKGNYSVDPDGYARLSVTIKNVPIGTYKITEKQVLRYYLAEATPNTTNVKIQQVGKAEYGKKPEDIAYGNATLDLKNLKAEITFRNEKQRFDDYSHNDVVRNTVTFKLK